MLTITEITIHRGRGSSKVIPVQGLSFSVPQGCSVALMGPSGVGKSSILLAIAGRIPVAQGHILVDHDDLTAAGPSGPRIAFVDQEYEALDFLTAVENVMLPLEFEGVPRGDAEEQALRQLESVGIGQLARRKPVDMSGGQRQRVVIARALVTSPRVLLADEPTAALDRATGASVIQDALAAARQRGGHVVIATHDPMVAELCDEVVRLSEAPAQLPSPA